MLNVALAAAAVVVEAAAVTVNLRILGAWPRWQSLAAAARRFLPWIWWTLLVLFVSGATLIVECTDPLAEIDIPNLIRETGDTLAATAREADVLVFTIRKG